MCHILLQDPTFFKLLLRIDRDLAAQAQALGCPCGSALHKANYPRKPRACPDEVRSDYESRFSFCCSQCRKRTTSRSVRFLGRRVYLALAVVLMSRRTGTSAQAKLSGVLAIPARTILRWQNWWTEVFPATPLWQAGCARFMPPVPVADLPDSLIERFADVTAESMMRLLVFLAPSTVRQ